MAQVADFLLALNIDKCILTVAMHECHRDGAAEVWGITAMAFSPNGSRLAIGNSDGDIKFMELKHLIPNESPKGQP